MYDQKENINRHNNQQKNYIDINKLPLKRSNYEFVSDEEKRTLLGLKKENFMGIFKKQSVLSKLSQGEGFDERSLGNNISNDDIEKDDLKFVKLPSIEYIVQEYQRQALHNALFRDKLMKLSDFCDNHTPLTSREEITEKKIDFSKHQKNKMNTHQNTKDEHTWFQNNFQKIQLQSKQQFSFHALTKKKIEEFKMEGNLEQLRTIVLLQYQNQKLQKLYQILQQAQSLNDIKTKLEGSDFQIMKKLIQGLKTFQ